MMLFTFLVRRILAGLLVLWVVSLLTFLLFFLRPANAVASEIAGKSPTPEVLHLINVRLGLNQPIFTQYLHYMGHLITGNLGYSFINSESVNTMIAQDLPRTASVVVGAVILWMVVGLSVGILSATRARSIFDRIATFGVLAGLSLPTFVLGQLLLWGVYLQLATHGYSWLQTGYVAPTQSISGWLGCMVLPWVSLATVSAATYSRLTRGSLIAALGEDYIKTARAKGLTERRVVFRHGVRAALAPVVSQLGIDIGALLGGVVVTEIVFGIDGLGYDTIHAVITGDLPVIMGFVLLGAAFVVVANLLVDLSYALLDPRVRIS